MGYTKLIFEQRAKKIKGQYFLKARSTTKTTSQTIVVKLLTDKNDQY